MGIRYESSILLGVHCTERSNRMHRSRRLSASNFTPECIENRFCHVIVGDNIIFQIILTIRVDYEILRIKTSWIKNNSYEMSSLNINPCLYYFIVRF